MAIEVKTENLQTLREVTIAATASLSGAVDLQGKVLCGVLTPAGWTDAPISFQASPDGVTYYNLYGGAGEEVVVGGLTASLFYGFAPAPFYAARYLKIRSGTSGAAVVQSNTVVLTLVARPM